MFGLNLHAYRLHHTSPTPIPATVRRARNEPYHNVTYYAALECTRVRRTFYGFKCPLNSYGDSSSSHVFRRPRPAGDVSESLVQRYTTHARPVAFAVHYDAVRRPSRRRVINAPDVAGAVHRARRVNERTTPTTDPHVATTCVA